jgi:acetyl-CoA carboxylase carboxyltransferase component
VPWCSILLRKVFGVAGAGHMNASRLRYRYAWPSGEWGSLPIAGGLEAAYKAELEASDDHEALQRRIEQRLRAVRSPFRTAEVFLVEEIIDPRDTRPLLCEFANLAAPLRQPGRASFFARP